MNHSFQPSFTMIINHLKARSSSAAQRLATATVVLITAVSILPVTTPAVSADQIAPVQPATSCRQVTLVAHRGSTHGLDKGYTEDSLNGFKASSGLAQRASSLPLTVVTETDIWRTRPDGNGHVAWINNHDATLNRTTNGSGTITSKTSQQISHYRTNDGQRLVHFNTAVRYMSGTNTDFEVEIKPSTASNKDLKYLVSVVVANNMQDRFEFTSFHSNVLRQLKQILAEQNIEGIRLGMLSNTVRDPSSVRHYADEIVYERNAATSANIRAAQNAGLSVGVFTVDSSTDWKRLINLGVNKIYTNQASDYRNWCAARS